MNLSDPQKVNICNLDTIFPMSSKMNKKQNNDIRQQIIAETTAFLKGETEEEHFSDFLTDCSQKVEEETTEYFLCQEIIDNIGLIANYPVILTREEFEYLCRCLVFLECDYSLICVKKTFFSLFNIISLLLLSILIYLYLYSSLPVILGYGLLISCSRYLRDGIDVSTPTAWQYHPFRSKEDWEAHRGHLVQDAGLIYTEEKFREEKDIKFIIWDQFLFWMGLPIWLFVNALPLCKEYYIRK